MELKIHENSAPNQENFQIVMIDAIYISVDPHSCVPYVRKRKTTRFAVFRFVSIFSGRGVSFLGPAASGILLAPLQQWSLHRILARITLFSHIYRSKSERNFRLRSHQGANVSGMELFMAVIGMKQS